MHITKRKVYTSELIVDTIKVEEQLTFRQRWIEPLLHGITMPFQPWVKTRMVTKTVPSRRIVVTPDGFIIHPSMVDAMRREMRCHTEDAKPPFRCAPPGKGQ